MMTLPQLPNRLFIKLLLGFWLCSSLIIAFVGALPLLQQRQERAPVPPQLEMALANVASRLQARPELLNSEFLQHWQRRRAADGKPLRLYLIDADGRLVNGRRQSGPRTLRHFMLMAEEAGHPIAHQFKTEFLFGPHAFSIAGQTYTLYGGLPDHPPRPWFFFFTENKLLTLGSAILLSGLLCGLLAWHLGKPLRSLKNSADALARGELGTRVDATTTGRKDEMGQLACAFNAMADAVQAMVNNQQRLMGDISHELRTPLTRLQLALALARQKGMQGKEADRIAYEAEQLDLLIGELLELSRVTVNARENKILLSLSESLSQVLDDAEFEAAQQGKRLLIDIDETLTLLHHPKSLSRAIENLLRNAIRYAQTQVGIEAGIAGDRLHIRICDDGPGVDDSELEAIFKPFYRPDSARERASGGWGLGLAITAAAIAAHGGEIRAENLSPHGLCVNIELPI